MSTNAKQTDGRDFKAKDVITQVQLDGLTAAQQSTRDQLAILRSTRGQREVGTVKVPMHLQQPLILTDNVQERNSRAGGDE